MLQLLNCTRRYTLLPRKDTRMSFNCCWTALPTQVLPLRSVCPLLPQYNDCQQQESKFRFRETATDHFSRSSKEVCIQVPHKVYISI